MSETGSISPPIRVLVVDDSAFMRTALARMIASESDFTVVGTARDGSEALERIPALDPDVVTLDVQMPGLDGLATLRAIMRRFPRPVIMVSADTEKDALITFNALGAGAFDYVPKQLSATSLDILHIRSDLLSKLHAAGLSRRSRVLGAASKKPVRSTPHPVLDSTRAILAVAIGSSTGGPKALEQILPQLPHDLSVPLLIVQHMPPGFTATFAERLNSLCAISVREAVGRDPVEPGIAYIAPAGIHMRIERRLGDSRVIIALDPWPSLALHIPSIDVMMKSVADIYQDHSMGIILTGMGTDGAEGMRAIQRAGGITLGQDQESCTVYGMPRVCAELGVLKHTVPLSDIALHIVHATRVQPLAFHAAAPG
jgi:two-component system, chemotaxis family, protein-glutamate methylesterase/glutaminase